MDSNQQDELAALFAEFGKSLSPLVQAMMALWTECTMQWEEAKFVEFHRQVHSLYGSAGMYGFDRVSEVAGRIQEITKPVMEQQSVHHKPIVALSLTQEEREKIQILLQELQSVLP